MNTKTREMTEGAVIVAIVGAFLLLDRQMANMLQGYLFWALPLPILIYTAKYGWKSGLLPYVCILLLSLVLCELTTVFIVFITNLTGLVYGAGVKLNKSNAWLFGTTLFFTAINYLVSMLVFAAFFGYDLSTELRTILAEMKRLGYTFDEAQVEKTVRLLIPIFISLSATLEALIVHIIAHYLLKKLHMKVTPLKSITSIKAPKWLGWILLALMVVNAANARFSFLPSASELFYALNIMSQLVFIAFGFINIASLAQATNRRYMVLIAMILFFLLPSSLMIFGIFDIVTDYRNRIIERSRYDNKQK